MVSQTSNTMPKSEPNRPPAVGGKSLKSFPVPPRAALVESGAVDGDEEEDVGLTVSEGDDADSDKEDDKEEEDEDNEEEEREEEEEDEDEDARIKALADDESPNLVAILGKESDPDSHPSNATAIATTSEEDENEDENDDDDDDHNALDDSSIEEEEEAAIKAELSRKSRRRSIPGPVSLRRLSQSQQARRRSQENSEESENESDHSSSSSSSWGNEYLEDYFDQPVNPSQQTTGGKKSGGKNGNDESQSDDESHLWQYFFSSEEGDDGFEGQLDEEDDTQSTNHTDNKLRQFTAPKDNEANDEADASTDDDMPLKGRGPIPLPHNANPSGYIPSGDSTDEDDGVPPERKRRRARGTKAIEVLGSDSFSTRPPVLGSWHIKGDKNVGIIDGLTTRTLSPPPMPRDRMSQYDDSPRNHGTPTRGGEPIDPFENLGDTPQDSVNGLFGDFAESSFDLEGTPTQADNGVDMHPIFDDVEVSDLDLLELGDYINTNGMSSDDNEHNGNENFEFELDFEHPDNQHLHNPQPRQFRSPVVSPYIYRSRFPSRSVPISAFRNRGSPYAHNPAYPSDNQSPAPRRMRGSSASGRRPSIPRDAVMSPARQTRKRMKKIKSGPGPRSALAGHHAPQNQANQSYDDGTHDLLGELIEIGAISPLFDINQ